MTAAAAIAQKYPDDGPHLIYLPERVFNIDTFLCDIKRVYDRLGRCVVAVSEGIKDASNTLVISSLIKNADIDAHGNLTLSGTGALGDLLAGEIKEKLGISRVRSDTFGYLQRSFLGCVSDVDQHEAREVGERAVQLALWQDVDGSVTIHRTGYYSVEYRMSTLEEVAGKTKLMPDEFIHQDGNHVTDAFKFYIRPLLGSKLGSPTLITAPKVDKILKVD